MRKRRGALRSAILPVAIVLGTCALVAWSSGSAHAQGKFVDLHGAVLAGGMTGGGSGAVSPDVFHEIHGAGFGAELGARLLVIDLSLRFVQMASFEGHHGTLLSALIGPAVEIPLRTGRGGPANLLVRPALAGGVAFATLAPVDPPLSNDQLAGKGLLVVGRLAIERMFGPFLGLGGTVEAGYHYFFNGAINGADHSSGWQLAAFGTVSFHLGI